MTDPELQQMKSYATVMTLGLSTALSTEIGDNFHD